MVVSKLTYCCETTLSHEVSRANEDCLRKIKDIIINEGGPKNNGFKDNYIALYIDLVERKSQSPSPKSTMDIGVGMSSGKRNRVMLLVEFKFNIGNPRNIGVSDLNLKIKNTKDIVGSDPPIHPEYIFVFQARIINQAKHEINKLFKNNPRYTRCIQVYDLNLLRETYFNR